MRREGYGAAPRVGRRAFLRLAAGAATLGVAGRAATADETPRRFTIGFANFSEDPGVRLEGLGFTGADVRTSFALAARGLPVDLVFYDNERDRAKAIANAEDAARRKLDLYIQYCGDEGANAEVGRRLAAAAIPVLALNHPVPGAPLYTADNLAAGRLAGEALARFAASNWRDRPLAAAIVGALTDRANRVDERAEGVAQGLRQRLPELAPARLDSAGNPLQASGQMQRFLAGAGVGKKLLVATLDDATALAVKAAVEAAGRAADSVIVSQGCDRSVHGGYNDKKEIDPNNRGSIVLGSVAYLLDHYGYEVLPLALHMLNGEALPPRTVTRHVLVTAANVFQVYPPTDMN